MLFVEQGQPLGVGPGYERALNNGLGQTVVDTGENVRADFVSPLVAYRSWILAVSLLFAAAVFVIKVLSPAEYTATAVVAATNASDGARSQIARLSGLASLAGIGIPVGGGGQNEFERFVYLLQSPELAEWQIQHSDVLYRLFPGRWDPNTKMWRSPDGFGEKLNAILGNPTPPEPDAYAVSRIYDRAISMRRIVSQNGGSEETGLVQISYTDEDKDRAQAMLQKVISDADEILRDEAATRSKAQSEYLRTKLNEVTVQAYRDSFEKLLGEQEQTLMLTNSHLPFAAERLSGSALPPERESKRILVFVLIGLGGGFSVAYFFAILAYNMNLTGPQRVGGRIRVVGLRASLRGLMASERGSGPPVQQVE
ncbi:MAG: hypothetical protein ISS15_19225 [Alphaproteobacteria bacterium]|nr:hypothetical protein [Alphaproteobacteria bacterium]MBL7099795.1 hypothetical protein [Alphaproteobacteria bacterium]